MITFLSSDINEAMFKISMILERKFKKPFIVPFVFVDGTQVFSSEIAKNILAIGDYIDENGCIYPDNECALLPVPGDTYDDGCLATENNLEINVYRGLGIKAIDHDMKIFTVGQIVDVDPASFGTHLSPQDHIRRFCSDLEAKLLAKFEAGAAEHGNNWQGVDCDKEMANEVLDLINYHCIKLAQDD